MILQCMLTYGYMSTESSLNANLNLKDIYPVSNNGTFLSQTIFISGDIQAS